MQLATLAQAVEPDALARAIFGVANGTVRAAIGVDPDHVLAVLDDAGHAAGPRRVLYLPLANAASAEDVVELLLDRLAHVARRVWPIWFTNLDFDSFGRDLLGREGARSKLRQELREASAVLLPWAEAAVLLALESKLPRVAAAPAATELAQLCLAIHRDGLILLLGVPSQPKNADALVHALEWISQNARVAMVALFGERCDDELRPFQRILHDAIRLRPEAPHEPALEPAGSDVSWIVPIRGIPHPLSEVERRLAAALVRDRELARLFCFNEVVKTVRGGRPRVDLLWREGRLVVELDGADHAARAKFIDDRHRDYELILSGYTVLRLANEEVSQDIEKAIEKIRDIVALCRKRTREEM